MSDYYRTKIVKGKEYKESKFYIPANKGVDFNEVELDLSPYFMGLMLGDGCFTLTKCNRAHFTSSLEDMEEYKKLLPYKNTTMDNRHHYWKVPNVEEYIRKLNLQDKKSHTKFIPDCYKYNSRYNRLELLKGLLDTDGHVGKDGNPMYTSVSKQLILDILEVARSLGINCKMLTQVNKYGEYYQIIFHTDITLFKLERKARKQRLSKTRHYKTAIVNIEYIGEEQAKCVTVDSDNSCYLIGDFVTTHNCKGVNATVPIKNFGFTLIRDWLLKPITITNEVDGEVISNTVPNLHFIKNRALIKELMLFNPDINVDRIMSLVQLMLYREEKMILYQGDMSNASKPNKDSSYLGNDKFFNRNYKPVNLAKKEIHY